MPPHKKLPKRQPGKAAADIDKDRLKNDNSDGVDTGRKEDGSGKK